MGLIKLLSFFGLAIALITSSMPFYFWARFQRYKSRRALAKLVSFHSKLALKLFGINVRYSGVPSSKGRKGSLLVCNHLSYIDVLILSAIRPACFVTSVEMKETFFLGQLCEAGGCLYVERRNKENLNKEILDITQALESGVDVVVFPEATSTNGEEVKRFKIPLFRAAINSGASIIPFAINYTAINNRPISHFNRDLVCWYGTMSFLPHLWALVNQSSVSVEVIQNRGINPSKEDGEGELSVLARSSILDHFKPIASI